MEIDILKNNFEVVYKEYIDYKEYVDSTKDEVQSQKDAFKDKAISGKYDDDTLVSALFDLSIKPIQEKVDLENLKNRLISVYDAYKILIDFPDNIKEEMSTLNRPTQTYRIFNGVQTEIDAELNEKFREEARKNHLEIVKTIKEQQA